MPFVEFLVGSRRTLLVLFAALTSGSIVAGTCHAADPKNSPTRPVLSSPQPMVAAPSGAELVGRLLAERAGGSDPDVPLPQRDLAADTPPFAPLAGPQIYGRRDEDSIVVGLKIPIPVGR
jgi:hypothetical protein